jgi:LmbE family N-acetylglucosaminyl deacetylase
VNILAIGAHPDDIEFGCGGTLIKYAQKGHGVHLLVMTDGERGGEPAEKRREQEAAAKALGAQQLFWGGYHETELALDRVVIQKLESVLHRVRPDLIIGPFGDDTHPDRRNLAAAVTSASRSTRNVLFYEGPTTANFTPSVYVDITAVLDRKLEALRAHASHGLRTGVEQVDSLELARAAAHFRGVQGRVRNAEGFMPLRLFINVD